MSAVEHVLAIGAGLGEGPAWHAEDAALYFVDINRQTIHRYEPGSGLHTAQTVAQTVTFLALGPSDQVLVGTADGIGIWHRRTNAIQILRDNVAVDPVDRFNDAAVGPGGRLWAGTLSASSDNHLFCMDRDGSVRVVESGLGISNGIGWSPDQGKMYHVDSAVDTIYVYDFDVDSGQLHDRRVFFQAEAGFGTPDGLTVDEAGYLWVAFWDGWKLARISPAGAVDRVIEMPVARPTSCAFGDDDRRTLYITSAADGLADVQNQPQAGDLFRLRVDVPGLPQTPYTIELPG